MGLAIDIVFVGGGLANCLAAYRLKQVRPSLNIAIVERSGQLGGNHLWSFHSSDVSPEMKSWLLPFIVKSWRRQHVQFPNLKRTLDMEYNSISSERLRDVICSTFESGILKNKDVQCISPGQLNFSDGTKLEANCVIDGRGWLPSEHFNLAYQKFVGLEVFTSSPHGLTDPIIMDATVEQKDGYRFVYSLPLDETTLLIEDTYYSDSATMNETNLVEGLYAYALTRGWEISDETRREVGVLPIILDADFAAYMKSWPRSIAFSGMRAGLFHPLTGYSLPDAVKFAEAFSQVSEFSPTSIAGFAENFASSIWRKRSYYRLLNRMFFLAAEPTERWRVLERFYALPEPLIGRFYSGNITLSDKLRILAGKPPVPVFKALQAISRSAAQKNSTGDS